MRGNLAEPGNAGRFECHVGIKAARDGAMNDNLFLLVQERNYLPLRLDRKLLPPTHVAEESHDGSLFIEERNEDGHPFEVREIEILAEARPHAVKDLH